MTFDNFDNLAPPGAISTDLTNIEMSFVRAFPSSSTRETLWKNYLAFLSELQTVVGTGFFQWIDGSFTTTKLTPRDIDLVTFLNWQVYELHEDKISDWRKTLKNKGLDGYFVKIYPKNHRLHYLYEADRAFWNYQFSYNTRTRKNKGFLQLNF